MAHLVEPNTKYLESFRELLIEAAEVGEAIPWDPAVDSSTDELERRIGLMSIGSWEPVEADRPPIPTSHFWWVEDTEILGRISLRHELVGDFGQSHGHIGYGVRPMARNLGHATQMLRATLLKAQALGIPSVLITCDPANIPSQKVITNCGGVFRDKFRDEVLRFDVATS
jgi:predicted acetyltransferase